MRPVLMAGDKVWKDYGEELVVTSGTDGVHSAGSLHYYGLAVDFRTRYFDKDVKVEVYKSLKEALSDDYQVVLEPTHMHIEFDPRPKTEEGK